MTNYSTPIFYHVIPMMVENKQSITNRTLFDDAFSKACIHKLIPMLTLPEFYQSSPEYRKAIITALELKETSEEKLNRKNKDQPLKEFPELFENEQSDDNSDDDDY